jgi:hypothetical protein
MTKSDKKIKFLKAKYDEYLWGNDWIIKDDDRQLASKLYQDIIGAYQLLNRFREDAPETIYLRVALNKQVREDMAILDDIIERFTK